MLCNVCLECYKDFETVFAFNLARMVITLNYFEIIKKSQIVTKIFKISQNLWHKSKKLDE